MEEKNIKLTNKNNTKLYSLKEENQLKLNKLLNDNEFLENNNYILRLLKKSHMLPEKFDLLLREKTPLILNNAKNEKKILNLNENKEENTTIGYTKNKTQLTYELDDLLYNHSKSFSKSKKKYYKIKKENDEFLAFYHFNKNMKSNILNMDRKLISSARKKKIKKIFDEKNKIFDVINNNNYLLMSDENEMYYYFLYKSPNERRLYTEQNPYKYISKIKRYLKNKTFDKREDSSSEQKSQDNINNYKTHKNKGYKKKYNKTETNFFKNNEKIKINNKLNIDNSLKNNIKEKIIKNKVNNLKNIQNKDINKKYVIKKIISLNKNNFNIKKNLNNSTENNFKGNNKFNSNLNEDKNNQNRLINIKNEKPNIINKNNNNINNINNIKNKGININKNKLNNNIGLIKNKAGIKYIIEKSKNIVNSNFKPKNLKETNKIQQTLQKEINLLTEQNKSIIISKELENMKNNKEEQKDNNIFEKDNNKSINLKKEFKSFSKNNTNKITNTDSMMKNASITEKKYKDNIQNESPNKINNNNNVYRKKLSFSNLGEYYSNLNQNKTITNKYSSKSNNSEFIDNKSIDIKNYNDNKQNIVNIINNNCNKYTIDSSQKLLIKDENKIKRGNIYSFTNIKKNSINSSKRKTIFGLYEEQKNKLNKKYRQNTYKINAKKRKTYDQLIFYDLDLLGKKKGNNKSSFITGTNNYSTVANKKYIINYYKGQSLDNLITDIKTKNSNNKWYKFLRNELFHKDQINNIEKKNNYLNNLDKYFIKKYSEFQVLISYADDDSKNN